VLGIIPIPMIMISASISFPSLVSTLIAFLFFTIIFETVVFVNTSIPLFIKCSVIILPLNSSKAKGRSVFSFSIIVVLILNFLKEEAISHPMNPPPIITALLTLFITFFILSQSSIVLK